MHELFGEKAANSETGNVNFKTLQRMSISTMYTEREIVEF